MTELAAQPRKSSGWRSSSTHTQTHLERAHPDVLRTAVLHADLVRSGLILAAFAVTLGGLHTILEGIGWWVLTVVLCIAVLGCGAAVRALLRNRPLLSRIIAPLAALGVSAGVLMLRFGDGTGAFAVIPTAQTLAHFQKLVRDAGYSITWQRVPATADEPISFVLAVGVVALVVFAEILAFSLRQPALVGLPIAAIFLVPGLTPEGKTDGWFFAASALVFLALLLAGRRWQVATSITVGAIAVIGGLVLPSVLPSTDITVTSSAMGPSVATGANPMLHLGRDLRQSQKRLALTYSTVSGLPEYLRLAEITDFSGESWGPDQPNLDPQNRPVAFPRPPGLAVGITTSPEVTYVHVANLLSPWLPVPYAASSVTGLTGSWQFLRDSFTVGSNTDLARGENYTVSSQQINPTPKQLLAASDRVPPELQRNLALPANTPELIATTAKRVTEAASSNYEKALAIQEFLRSEPFRYSESAPETKGYDDTGVAVVAAFLQQHEGYCIHFASAMAVMARTIGIPSRIIVGFQPGTLQSEKDDGRPLFAVTTKDLHAWPELYFDTIGWVRFEPTPSRGAVPAYANQDTAGVPQPVAPDSGNSNLPGRDAGAGTPQIDDTLPGSPWLNRSWLGGEGGWILLTLGASLCAIIAVVFTPVLIRRLRRRRRLRGSESEPMRVISLWREIVETAEDAGLQLSPTLTPRAAANRLERGRKFSETTGQALARVVVALERESYGPLVSVGLPDPLSQSLVGSDAKSTLVGDTRQIISALAASVPSGQRMRAFLLPASLISRTKQAVTRWL